MNREELYSRIDERNKIISSMGVSESTKVANLVFDTVEEYLSVDPLSFDSKELIDIFESARPDISKQVRSDAEGLLDNTKPYLIKTGFFGVQMSLKRIQAQLRIYPSEL